MSELARLKWQCRRGTLELDIILENYLDSSYREASEQEKSAFLELLALQDTELLAYLMGSRTAQKKNIADLIAKMRGAAAPDSGR